MQIPAARRRQFTARRQAANGAIQQHHRHCCNAVHHFLNLEKHLCGSRICAAAVAVHCHPVKALIQRQRAMRFRAMHANTQRVLARGIERKARASRNALHHWLHHNRSGAGVHRRLKTCDTCGKIHHPREQARQNACTARCQRDASRLQQQRAAHLNRVEPQQHRVAVAAAPAIHRQSAAAQRQVAATAAVYPTALVDGALVEEFLNQRRLRCRWKVRIFGQVELRGHAVAAKVLGRVCHRLVLSAHRHIVGQQTVIRTRQCKPGQVQRARSFAQRVYHTGNRRRRHFGWRACALRALQQFAANGLERDARPRPLQREPRVLRQRRNREIAAEVVRAVVARHRHLLVASRHSQTAVCRQA